MKKILLLLFLLGLKSVGFGQSKPEFGFVLKTGNFTHPSAVRPDGFTPIPPQGGYHQNIGQTHTLGIYQAFPLGKRLRLSTELLYRAVYYSNEELNYLNFFDGSVIRNSVSQTRQNIQLNSLSLPVLLQYSFRKKPNLSIFSGIGLAHIFSANILSKTDFHMTGQVSETQFFPAHLSGWSNFDYNISFYGGIKYSLSSRTSLGLEFVHEKQSAYFTSNLFFEHRIGILIPNIRVFPPAMNSFSLSLRHNIL